MHRRAKRVDTAGLRRRATSAATRIEAALVLLLAFAPTACAGSHRGPWQTSRGAELELQVHNDNYLDMAIYALPDGGRVRLGTVTGKSHAALKIPAGVVVGPDGFRLEADPVGSPDTYVTERIVASPGSTVVLRVGSVLRMSSWHLR